MSATTPPLVQGRPAKVFERHFSSCLNVFTAIVVLHWLEHLVQAYQIYALGWPRPEAGGVLGLYFPVLISSEILHYGFAIVMLAGLWILRHGFEGAARQWWTLALALQFWHHIEHLLLIIQATTGHYLGGGPVPSSLIQLLVPRVELHLFYNAIVTIPMVVAVVLHQRSDRCASVPTPGRA